MNRVFVIGAGVAGLACAVRLAASGSHVILCEATDHGGGRCRSLSDPGMDRVIDNGNHLLLSGNTAALSYLDAIGARDRLLIAPDASIPFVDLRTGLRWTVRPNKGRIPWWIFSAKRRIPGTRPRDYLAGLKLAFASDKATIADCFDQSSPAFERFWRPLAIAVLNIAPEKGSAKLLWPVLAAHLRQGCCREPPLHRPRRIADDLHRSGHRKAPQRRRRYPFQSPAEDSRDSGQRCRRPRFRR